MSTKIAVMEGLELIQVQVIFRHGARTPCSWTKEQFDKFTQIQPQVWDSTILNRNIAEVPDDINHSLSLEDGSSPTTMFSDATHVNFMEGGCATGQLTNIGKRQLYQLGKQLATTYISKWGFLSPRYTEKEVYARTTYYKRTTESLLHLLAGMYHPSSTPFSIETKESQYEDMVPDMSSGCFLEWTQMFMENEERSVNSRDLQRHVNSLLGLKDQTEEVPLSHVGDLMRCREAHNIAIPQYLLDERTAVDDAVLDMKTRWLGRDNTHVLSTCIGSFVDTLCERMQQQVQVERGDPHKLLLYSGHDYTILPLLLALGVRVREWPPFAANIIIELYKTRKVLESTIPETGDSDTESCASDGSTVSYGEHFIRVVYNGEPLVLDKDLNQDIVNLERFFHIVEEH